MFLECDLIVLEIQNKLISQEILQDCVRFL